MNWKNLEGGHGLRYCVGICLEGLRNIKRNPGQDSRCPSRDSNPATTEYQSTFTNRRIIPGYTGYSELLRALSN
jgi:hypothetical protein